MSAIALMTVGEMIGWVVFTTRSSAVMPSLRICAHMTATTELGTEEGGAVGGGAEAHPKAESRRQKAEKEGGISAFCLPPSAFIAASVGASILPRKMRGSRWPVFSRSTREATLRTNRSENIACTFPA